MADDTVPSRVVCLAPSYTETMTALGLASNIVGVTTSSDHVKEVEHAERVGLFMRPSLEKVLSLRPDLVFASKYSGQQALIDKLRALKVRVIIMEMNRIKDIQNMVHEMGAIFQVPEKAEQLNDDLSEALKSIAEKTKGLAPPRIYVEAGSDPLFTCGPGSFIHEMLQLVGARNIAGDMTTPYPRISSELIISRNPEIILLPYMAGTVTKAEVKKRAGWDVISAVKNDRICDDLGTQMITIPSPRLILKGLPELLERVHPGPRIENHIITPKKSSLLMEQELRRKSKHDSK